MDNANAACRSLGLDFRDTARKELKKEYMMVVTFGTCPTFPK